MDTLKINGVEKQFPAGQFPADLAELLEQLNIESATVVAEIDEVVIDKNKFAQTKLKNGQSIELIKFMGGG